MINKHLIDIVYDNVKKNYENKQFPFSAIWKTLVKDAKLSAEEQRNEIGNLYVDILQDTRFVYVGNQKWRLREYLTQDEIANLQYKLYDFQQEALDDANVDSLSDLSEEDDNFDEDQKEAEEDIKSNISGHKENEEEE